MQHWFYILVSDPQTLFTALAALASMAAVITSLYIAIWKRPSANLSSRIDWKIMFPDETDILEMQCTNNGLLDVTVTGVSIGLRGVTTMLWMKPNAHEFPKRISFSETCSQIDQYPHETVKAIAKLFNAEFKKEIETFSDKKLLKKLHKVLYIDFHTNTICKQKSIIPDNFIKKIMDVLKNKEQ